MAVAPTHMTISDRAQPWACASVGHAFDKPLACIDSKIGVGWRQLKIGRSSRRFDDSDQAVTTTASRSRHWLALATLFVGGFSSVGAQSLAVDELRQALPGTAGWTAERVALLTRALDPDGDGRIERADLDQLVRLASGQCDERDGATAPPVVSGTSQHSQSLTVGSAARGPAFMRGEPPQGKRPTTARYYFRPVAPAPGDRVEDDDPAFERCAARCLSAEFDGKCWFLATSGERDCTIHTGLFAMTSFSV